MANPGQIPKPCLLEIKSASHWFSGHVEFESNIYTFLNKSTDFGQKLPEWNFLGHGLLWNYNLNYFDFLLDENCTKEKGIELIENYCAYFDKILYGLDPYPISLRMINWIKFLSKWEIRDDRIDGFIFKQFEILRKRLEYHLMANHLLENAFSMLFGAYYFKYEPYYLKAIRILKEQLKEQILSDGGHFERSPMYHQIILFRLLDSIDLLRRNDWKEDSTKDLFSEYAGLMLGWINNVTFKNGHIPLVNDTAPNIAPSTEYLNRYADDLSINKSPLVLGQSGYRMFKFGQFELFADVGRISPNYQPGHSHADELNFLVYAARKPLIVDTGISTYENNTRRQNERATSAHNCVVINNSNSSEVWGGFRVARRAKVNILKDEKNHVVARHNGFTRFGIKVERSFLCEDNSLEVVDKIHGDLEKNEARSYLHFNSDFELKLIDNQIVIGPLKITLEGFHEMHQEKYKFAKGFNSLAEGTRLNLKPSNLTKIIIAYAN